RRRMACQNSPERAGRTVADFLERLEHLNHPASVITGVLEIVESQEIGFAFGFAAVFHQVTARDHVARKPAKDSAGLPAKDVARNRRDAGKRAVFLPLFIVLQAVTTYDVADFVP